MAEQPIVQLSFDVHWCARHLRPFAENWPQGASVAMVELMQAAVAMPAVVDECPVVDGKADAAYLDAALRRFSPLCCFVGRAKLEEIYSKAGVTR